ncbi:MAG: hypothetical protein Q8Q23_05520 [bacterium]|nr:hypothetical protein [bacterium]
MKNFKVKMSKETEKENSHNLRPQKLFSYQDIIIKAPDGQTAKDTAQEQNSGWGAYQANEI